jgi:small subunit ribosomal protein S4e
MAKRGPRKHLKRLTAPKHWMLSKVGGIWATKPGTGPHKTRECVPLNVILRNKLKLALNSREAKLIILAKEGNVAIDGKIRKDIKYPVGFMDVLTLVKSKTSYRMLYDCKGKFGLNKISQSEAEFKLCKVKARSMGPKGIPYIVTHDGRTVRFPDPAIKTNDTVRVNLTNGEITDSYKFEKGAHVMINGGNNIGRMGVLTRTEKHDGSYDIIYVKDANGEEFSTRLTNVFVIGNNKPEITVMKSHNRLNIMKERGLRTKRKHLEVVDDAEEEE